MAARIENLGFDCAEPYRLAQFWVQLLKGYSIAEGSAEGADEVSLTSGLLDIFFTRVPEGKVVKNRVHLDLYPETTVAEEIARLIPLGATQQGTFSYWTVMQDPEGNEFCLVKTLQEREAEKA